MRAVVDRVIADDAKLPRNYDPRWIALQGMDFYAAAPLRFQPASEWSATNAKTRRQWLSDFREAVDALW